MENNENNENNVNNTENLNQEPEKVEVNQDANTTEVKEEVKKEVREEVNQGPVKEPKKSNTGLIVTIVILAVVVVILLCVGLFLWARSSLSSLVGDSVNEVTSIIEDGENTLEGAGSILNTVESNAANDIFGVLSNTVDNGNTTVSSSSNARTSTLENPLQLGEWGIASKYNTNTSSDQNVNVRVSNIIRGEEAKKMAQEYMNSDYSIYKYEKPEAYQEWVVIEYDVDFADTYVPGELGASPNVNGDVTGPDGSSVKYNGITYINSVIEIGSRDYIQTKTGSGKLLTQLPVGCTDYIIEFGTYDGTKAYFKGQ